MKYYDAAGAYNPHAGPALIADSDCSPEGAPAGWANVMGDAQMAVWATLDELALLASIATADTISHALAPIPAGLPACSLLLEPALFMFPS